MENKSDDNNIEFLVSKILLGQTISNQENKILLSSKEEIKDELQFQLKIEKVLKKQIDSKNKQLISQAANEIKRYRIFNIVKIAAIFALLSFGTMWSFNNILISSNDLADKYLKLSPNPSILEADRGLSDNTLSEKSIFFRKAIFNYENNLSDAIKDMERSYNIAIQNSSPDKDEIGWYLALLYLKNDDLESTYKILDLIDANEINQNVYSNYRKLKFKLNLKIKFTNN